jgi:hypothetical protein
MHSTMTEAVNEGQTIHICKTANIVKSPLTTDKLILSSERTSHNDESVTVKTETDIWS